MLPSVIKTKFMEQYDDFANPVLDNPKLTDLFTKASVIYWAKLADQWGYNEKINEEIAPIIKTFSVANPTTNLLSTSSDLANYDRMGAMTLTFSDGNSGVCKFYNEESKLSPTSAPTTRYPKYDFYTDGSGIEQVRLYPRATAVTLATGNYLRIYYEIDFDTADDVPGITEKNIQGIIDIAIRLQAAFNRDGQEYPIALQQENINQQ